SFLTGRIGAGESDFRAATWQAGRQSLRFVRGMDKRADMTTSTKKLTQHRAGSPVSAREPATENDVRVRVFRGHGGSVSRVALPADGRFAITSSIEDGTVRRWELEADEAKSEIIYKTPGGCGLAVKADGSHAAAGDVSGTIHVFSLASAREAQKWQGHERTVGSLAFLAEDREVVSVAMDGYLRRWDAKTGARIAQCKA